jgi:DNA invertase Pin-like site-specific DNA recombinase
VFSTAGGEADLRDDDADPSRKLVRRILGAVAEYERELLLLRLRRGRQLKAARGGYAGLGSPPYGWRAEDRELARSWPSSRHSPGCASSTAKG